MSLEICPWKYGKRWVYSITYDEALADLHRFAIPVHEEYGIPGHVEVVVGQMGEIRNIGKSSFNGYRHMNGDELRDLLALGWGVGNHSWSHEVITPETVEREIGQAKRVLEEALGEPIILYCSPGDNTNMADHVLEVCRNYGYLGAMSITDALNLPGDELFWINRTPLHDHYYPPFYSAFDPYRNIRQAPGRAGLAHRLLPLSAGDARPSQQGLLRNPVAGSALKRYCPRAVTRYGARCPKKRSAIT